MLTCVTLNVRGLNNYQKRKRLFTWLESKHYDVIFLQETFCTENFKQEFDRDWKGKAYHAVTTSKHSKGVCILFSSKKKLEVIKLMTKDDGRVLFMNVNIDDENFSLINVYAPNNVKHRGEFLKSINHWILEHNVNDHRLILGGDFNCCDSQKDKSTPLKDSCVYFSRFKEFLNVCDSWRHCNPDSIQYTYFDPGNVKYGSRIDYILCSSSMIENVLYSNIVHAPVPDHSAVVSGFNIDSEPRGQGYWKLNISILEELEYKQGIRSIIRDTKCEYNDVNPSLVWEFIKIRVKEFSIKYCQAKHRKRNRYVEALEHTVNKIKQFLVEGKGDTQCLKDRKEILEREIDTVLSEKAIGAQIRARAKWIEKGEKSTSYFLRLEKHHQSSNVIKGLKNRNNEIIYGSEKSLTVMRDFYKNLYSSQDVSHDKINRYFSKIESVLTLSKEQQTGCEGQISMQDCEEALKKMKKNKSPGLDGLPIEFY